MNESQKLRYARQLIIPDVAEEGQLKLFAARVMVLGAGGLGSAVIPYLAAAGVGLLGIVDSDEVHLSNLNRQVIHDTPGIGTPKALSAAARMHTLNPDVKIIPIVESVTPENIESILAGYDIAVDCTDNFHTRYLLNDACMLARKPLVHGSVFEFEGQASTFVPDHGPCYRCLFPLAPPPDLYNGSAPGVIGAAPALIGAVEAVETIKLIIGAGETLSGRLLIFDGLKMRFRELSVSSDPSCPVCGKTPTIKHIDPACPDYYPAK